MIAKIRSSRMRKNRYFEFSQHFIHVHADRIIREESHGRNEFKYLCPQIDIPPNGIDCVLFAWVSKYAKGEPVRVTFAHFINYVIAGGTCLWRRLLHQ